MHKITFDCIFKKQGRWFPSLSILGWQLPMITFPASTGKLLFLPISTTFSEKNEVPRTLHATLGLIPAEGLLLLVSYLISKNTRNSLILLFYCDILLSGKQLNTTDNISRQIRHSLHLLWFSFSASVFPHPNLFGSPRLFPTFTNRKPCK